MENTLDFNNNEGINPTSYVHTNKGKLCANFYFRKRDETGFYNDGGKFIIEKYSISPIANFQTPALLKLCKENSEEAVILRPSQNGFYIGNRTINGEFREYSIKWIDSGIDNLQIHQE